MELHEMEQLAEGWASKNADRYGSEYWRGLRQGYLNGLIQAKNISSNPPVMGSVCDHEWQTLTDENEIKYQACKKCWKVNEQTLR